MISGYRDTFRLCQRRQVALSETRRRNRAAGASRETCGLAVVGAGGTPFLENYDSFTQ
jgi:hypothetical protein